MVLTIFTFQNNKTMQNETNQEKDYIEIIIRQISSKLQLNNPDSWQQRDFENLSTQIEEKTGISLSISTLKRITKKPVSKYSSKKHTECVGSTTRL